MRSGCGTREQAGSWLDAADGRLRGAPRILGADSRGQRALPLVPRARRDPHSVRQGDGLHPHRAAAGDGAPVLGVVGLSGDRLLRADQPLRVAGRLPRVRRCLPPQRHRRDSRLGARAFSQGRARAGAIRRHRALRACRSAPGRTSRLGHADLQLRPQRGPQLPARQRALLAARVPRRRPARRRGRLDALPRLLAQGRGVGAEPLRRPREPRRDRVPAGSSTR